MEEEIHNPGPKRKLKLDIGEARRAGRANDRRSQRWATCFQGKAKGAPKVDRSERNSDGRRIVKPPDCASWLARPPYG